MNLKMALAVCLTVDAGCIKYRLNVEQYSGHCGNRYPEGMRYQLRNTIQTTQQNTKLNHQITTLSSVMSKMIL